MDALREDLTEVYVRIVGPSYVVVMTNQERLELVDLPLDNEVAWVDRLYEELFRVAPNATMLYVFVQDPDAAGVVAADPDETAIYMERLSHHRDKAYCACNRETGACCGGSVTVVVQDIPLASQLAWSRNMLHQPVSEVVVFAQLDAPPPRQDSIWPIVAPFLDIQTSSVRVSSFYDVKDIYEPASPDSTISIVIIKCKQGTTEDSILIASRGSWVSLDRLLDQLSSQRVVLLLVSDDESLLMAPITHLYDATVAGSEMILFLPSQPDVMNAYLLARALEAIPSDEGLRTEWFLTLFREISLSAWYMGVPQ